MFTVTCLNGDGEFEAARSTAKFHNDACRMAYKRKMLKKKEEQLNKFSGKAKIITDPKKIKVEKSQPKKKYGSYLEGGYEPFVNTSGYTGAKSRYKPYYRTFGAGTGKV